MRSQGRGEHAIAKGAAVAAGARTGSSAGLAKSPWRGIGRRLSWSSNILPSGLDRPASGHRRPFPHIRSAILKTSQPRMAIPTPQKSMTETTASSYFLHGTYGLRRRTASNKLLVRLSGEVVGPLALRQGHLYAAGPSVGACFFRTIFCAFAPCPATKAPALPHSEAGASPFVRTGVVMMQLLRLRRDLSLRAISAAWPSKATSASAASRSG
jgi:hypothetical protein